jgi:hypothetical protein
MTRPTDRKPPSPNPGPGRGPLQKPGRNPSNAETFGRFVGNLARLETTADKSRTNKEGGR